MVKTLFKETWAVLKTKTHPLWLLVVLIPLFVIFSLDQYAVNNWIFPEDSIAHNVARFISKHGDFYNASMVIVAICFVGGLLLKNKRMRMIALCMVLACATSGLLSLGIRVFSGRPRPATVLHNQHLNINTQDGLYGLRFKEKHPGVWHLDYGYQSMPSGHTTTAVATAMPLLILAPPVGVILTVGAVAVAWARFQLRRHWPSDLYIGALFGGLFGVAFGVAARRQLHKAAVS